MLFLLRVYLLVNVHRLKVVDVATLDPLGCLRRALQHCPLPGSKATKVSDTVGPSSAFVGLLHPTCCAACTG